MFDLLRRLKSLLNQSDVRALIILSLMMVGAAALEVLGVGIILPFIALLNDETFITKNKYVFQFYQWLNPVSFREFLQWSILLMISLFVVKNAYLFGVMTAQSRFLKKLHARLCRQLFDSYLYSSYAFTLQRNSAQQIRNLDIVASVINGIVAQLMTLTTELAVSMSVFFLVVWVNPGPALFVGGALIVAVGAFYFLIRKKLKKWGMSSNIAQGYMLQDIQQGLGSVKEIRVLGREEFFSKAYARDVDLYLETSRICLNLTQVPRFYIESVVVTILLGSMGAFLLVGKPLNEILVSISVFAVASIRLMPSLGRISASLNSIRFYTPSLREVYDDLTRSESFSDARPEKGVVRKLSFKSELTVEDVHFQYEGAKGPSLGGVSMTIKKNSMVGFAGPSGAGKTTLVDIGLGLLSPTRGRILVDGVDIRSDMRAWQRQLGYIPQNIYLLDGSIRTNVALGISDSEIEDGKIWQALELAQLSAFVKSLPNGFNTVIGEHGVRLSGGQRQRIGIARALYHEPEILVMDEATAALDNKTEELFMESLTGLMGKKTILIIAHRLTTLRNCDEIYYLKEGAVSAQGNYSQLFAGQSPEQIQI